MKDNIIFNDMDETIGYYKDLAALLKSQAIDLLNQNDYENAQYQIECLSEMEKYKEYDGLLVLSENNGMGFTCSEYEKPIDN